MVSMMQVVAKFRDQNEGLTALVVGACAAENPVKTRRDGKPGAVETPVKTLFYVLLRDDTGGLVETRGGLTLTEAVRTARCLT